MLGETIDGRYQLTELIGHGGMGTVYRALDTDQNETVAVKMLNVNLAVGIASSRLHREFRVLTRLDHPRIVRAHSYGTHQENPYLVMDYLFGHTLSTELAGSPLHRSRLLHIARQICDALTHLHAQSIIHRDLKPANIMLLPPGDSPEVKLMDFGLVRVVQQHTAQLTQEGSTLGTVAYMPPEQAQGLPVDFRADLYSFGAVLYEMATGRPPFVHENPATVLLQQVTAQPVSPQQHNPELDDGLAQFILQLLAKDPQQRPASTKLVAARLEALQSDTAPVLHTPLQPTRVMPYVPLVGRESAFAQLVTHWQQVEAGQGQVLLLSGVVGAGKGRFLEEARLRARVGDDCFLRGRSREHGSLPYQPVVDILDSLVRQLPPQKVAVLPEALQTLLPRLGNGNPAATDDPGTARLRLYNAFLTLFRQMPADKSILLAIEEAQWADAATLELVAFLASRLSRLRLLLVLSYRPEETTADSPLPSVLREIGRFDHVHTLTLDLLNREQVGIYLRLALGWEGVPDWLIDSFHQGTGGNPLFIEETLKVLAAEGEVDDWDKWTTSTSTTTILHPTSMILRLPDTVLALAQRRLQVLSAAERTILTTAAVIGPEFSFDLLQAVAGEPEETLIDVVDSLLTTSLIAELPLQNGEDRYAFSQEALRQALLNNVSQRRRRLLHRRTGEALSSLYDTQEPRYWPVQAYHYAEAGQNAKALKYLILAGDAAARLYAHEEAIAHYTAALSLTNETPASLMQFIHLYNQRGRSLELNQQHARALKNYEEMERQGIANDNPLLKLHGMIQQSLLYITPTQLADMEKGRTLAEKSLALANAIENRPLQAKALWNLLLVNLNTGDLAQATANGEASLAIARDLNLTHQLAFTLNDIQQAYLADGQPAQAAAALAEAQQLWRIVENKPMLASNLALTAFNAYMSGNYQQAMQSAREGEEISNSINDLWSYAFNRVMQSYAHMEMGFPEQALAIMREIRQFSDESSFLPVQVMGPSNMAWIYNHLGAFNQAMDLAQQAMQRVEEAVPGMRREALTAVALTHIRQRELDAAAPVLQEAQLLFARKQDRTWLDSFLIHFATAELAILQGDYETAAQRMANFIDRLRVSQLHTYLIEALFWQGRALAGQGHREQATAVLEEAAHLSQESGSLRMQWPVWLALAHLQEQSDRAEQYRQKAQAVMEQIKQNIKDSELQETFTKWTDSLLIVMSNPENN